MQVGAVAGAVEVGGCIIWTLPLPAMAQLNGCPLKMHAPLTIFENAMWNWWAKSALSPSPAMTTVAGSMLSSGRSSGAAAARGTAARHIFNADLDETFMTQQLLVPKAGRPGEADTSHVTGVAVCGIMVR